MTIREVFLFFQPFFARTPLKVVQNEKEGGCEWYQSEAFNSSTFPPILKKFVKDPGPLKRIKHI
jgi:hypothetical protein